MECPRITGGSSPARRADKKEETYGFLLLANHPLSLRRAAGADYRSPAKRMPPTCQSNRNSLAATPEGRGFPFLLLFESGRQSFSATHLCARERVLICGSKCRKFSGRRLCVCFYLEGKGVIRKRGETFGVSPLVRPRRAGARTPRAAARGTLCPLAAGIIPNSLLPQATAPRTRPTACASRRAGTA